jgi:hypothetical protein
MMREFGIMNSEFGMPPTNPGAVRKRACINSEFRILNSEFGGWVD